jgi:predicted PhzF superfamily epimerase YddE/YHI9
LGKAPKAVLQARDALAVFDTPEDVQSLAPDFAAIARLDYWAVIATAPGHDGIDFVSRFFAPGHGVNEDPVTGSAHCTLVPYWSKRLGKKELLARQISHRGGTLRCRDDGDRVRIAGQAVFFLEGTITLPE